MLHRDVPLARGPLGDLTVDGDGGLYVDDVGYATHRGKQPRPGLLIYVAPAEPRSWVPMAYVRYAARDRTETAEHARLAA